MILKLEKSLEWIDWCIGLMHGWYILGNIQGRITSGFLVCIQIPWRPSPWVNGAMISWIKNHSFPGQRVFFLVESVRDTILKYSETSKRIIFYKGIYTWGFLADLRLSAFPLSQSLFVNTLISAVSHSKTRWALNTKRRSTKPIQIPAWWQHF